MARGAINSDGEELLLASLIERSAELKRDLVAFTCSPRFERHLGQFMLEAVDPEGILGEDPTIFNGGGYGGWLGVPLRGMPVR